MALVALWTGTLAVRAEPPGEPVLSVAAWEKDVQTLRATPGLVRFHTFFEPALSPPDVPGVEAPMVYRPGAEEPRVTQASRVAGRTNAVLDDACYESAPLLLPVPALTVSIWLKPFGMGTRRGNDESTNGMIICSGSGYYDGWRIAVFDEQSRRPCLEIGRPEGAFGLTAQDSLRLDHWNHVVAWWDGARVRLYVNGVLSAEAPFTGTFIAPQGGLRVGYAGYGVGSLRMAVDEVAVFDRALPDVPALNRETLRAFFFPPADRPPQWNAEPHRHPPSPLPEPAMAFYVSPAGRDDQAGTRSAPFATLERAREAVRGLPEATRRRPGGVTVYLRGGVYPRRQTFSLGPEDAGTERAPMVYRAWPGEQPILDGGLRVGALTDLADDALRERIPPEARAFVRVATVENPALIQAPIAQAYGCGMAHRVVRDLYENGAPLPLARWPNDAFLNLTSVVDEVSFQFADPEVRMARWSHAPAALAAGYWKYLWADAVVPVAALDPERGLIRLAQKPGYGLEAGQPFYVLNLLEELDRPGEWYFDATAGRLYVWPRASTNGAEFVLSNLDRPFISVNDAAHLVFDGLTLQHGQQDGIELQNCLSTRITNCRLQRLGGTGLMAPQVERLLVYGNHVENLGHAGMHVGGGDRAGQRPSGNLIENNEVSHFGRHARTYTPAVLLEGWGARVAHNEFHHAPSSALRVEGNEHVIEFNYIHHVVQESDDQGALDMWGDPTYRGVVIRYNRWADVGDGAAPCGRAGVRLDDAICGVHIYGNRFERASRGNFGGVQIHGGKDNRVEWNLFLDCRIGISFSPWEPARWEEFLDRKETLVLTRERFDVRNPAQLARYPELARLREEANANTVARNLLVGSEIPFTRPHAHTDLHGNARFATLDQVDVTLAPFTLEDLPPESEIGTYPVGNP